MTEPARDEVSLLDLIRVKITAALRAGAAGCSLCRHNELKLSPYLFAMAAYAPTGTTATPAVMPFVAVTCPRCGHTTMYNAVALGIIDARTGAPCQGEGSGDTRADHAAA
jgi:hypothetical protein